MTNFPDKIGSNNTRELVDPERREKDTNSIQSSKPRWEESNNRYAKLYSARDNWWGPLKKRLLNLERNHHGDSSVSYILYNSRRKKRKKEERRRAKNNSGLR